ncbi:MAG: ANTAR domain-containing protein [Sphaerochaetaceae bacterium]
MSTALVVSATEKSTAALTSLIHQLEGAIAVTSKESASEARRQVLDYEYDLVIINTPLSDEDGLDLSKMIIEETLSPVILLVRNEFFSDIQSQMENFGVLVVQKPIIREVFFQTLGLAKSLRRRLVGMQNENEKLQKKIDEIKVVDQAKWTLIRTLGMNEEQAHRYIEKQAMDMRRSRYDIASCILKTYR